MYLVTILLLSSFVAPPHHNFAMNYDATKLITITGKVTRFAYKKPHIEIDIVEEKTGKEWTIETFSTTIAKSYDFKKDTLAVGDPVIVKGWMAKKEGSKKVGGQQIVLPDGRVFVLQRSARESPGNPRFKSVHGFLGEMVSPTPRELMSKGEFVEQMAETSFIVASLQTLLKEDKSKKGQLSEIENLQVMLFNSKSLVSLVPMSESAKKHFADEAKARSAMRIAFVKALGSTLAMEEQAENGDAEAAGKTLEELLKHQRASHAIFQEHDEAAHEHEDEKGEEVEETKTTAADKKEEDHGDDEAEEDPKVIFYETMEAAGAAISELNELLNNSDSKKEKQLLELENLQVAMFNCKSLIPEVEIGETAMEKYSAEDKARAAMRLGFIKSLHFTLAMEESIENGDTESGLKSLKEMVEHQKASHLIFQD